MSNKVSVSSTPDSVREICSPIREALDTTKALNEIIGTVSIKASFQPLFESLGQQMIPKTELLPAVESLKVSWATEKVIGSFDFKKIFEPMIESLADQVGGVKDLLPRDVDLLKGVFDTSAVLEEITAGLDVATLFPSLPNVLQETTAAITESLRLSDAWSSLTSIDDILKHMVEVTASSTDSTQTEQEGIGAELSSSNIGLALQLTLLTLAGTFLLVAMFWSSIQSSRDEELARFWSSFMTQLAIFTALVTTFLVNRRK